MLHDAVEAVAVRDQQPLARGRDVHDFIRHFYITEGQADELPHHGIVVARHIDHARSLARAAQEFLHHIVVRLRPVPATAQLPAVQNVANQIQRVRFVVLQEIEQELGLATGRAEVDVGDPERAVVAGRMGGSVRRIQVRVGSFSGCPERRGRVAVA